MGWLGPDRTPEAARRCQKDLLVGCREVRGSEGAERGARGMGSRGGSTAERQGPRQTIGRRGRQCRLPGQRGEERSRGPGPRGPGHPGPARVPAQRALTCQPGTTPPPAPPPAPPAVETLAVDQVNAGKVLRKHSGTDRTV